MHKGNDSITGLTTAAMIWGAGGIGIAVGAGFYMEAALTVAIVLIGIEATSLPLMTKFGPKTVKIQRVVLLRVLSSMIPVSITKVYEYLGEKRCFI